MKVSTVRQRIEGMSARLHRDLAAFEKMFPGSDFGDSDYPTEVVRNMATACKYLEMTLGMADDAIERNIQDRRREHSNGVLTAEEGK